jgi:hypothetical protein
MDKITIIKSIQPNKVCKTYTNNGETLDKSVIANVIDGEAITVSVPNADAMVKILSKVTDKQDLVICPGVWHGAEDKQKFKVMTERQLAETLGVDLAKVPGGVIEHAGERISARLKRGISYSAWMLLDADNPPGMPSEWACLDIGERLKLWDAIVPGISQCERIELRGSSARVHKIGEQPSANASHAWIKVSDPEKIAILKSHIRVHMVLKGLSFTFDKVSKNDGIIVGKEDRSLFDLAVMDTGRLVFCAKPEVISWDHAVADAGITIKNAGAGPLDLSWVDLPNQRALEDIRVKTGLTMRMSRENGGINTVVTGELTMNTPIEVRGVTRSLGEWASTMQPQDRIRCEAPFRVSQSEAAFIRMGDNGLPFVHDIGSGTTYTMQREIVRENPLDDFDYIPDTPDLPSKTPARQQPVSATPTGSFDDWVFLTRRGVFRNVFTGEECSPAAFNLAYSRDVPPVEVKDRIIQVQASKYLMNYIEGRIAHDVLYFPSLADPNPIFEYEGVAYVNSYMLNRVPKPDPNWKTRTEWKVCEAHLKNILPNDWKTLLNWMAHNVQKPGAKVLWAPIVKGIQGDGKSTLARIMGAAMGQHNVRMIATEEMQSDFNGWAEGACVGVLEEIRIKGHNRHDAMNKLKPLVTNEKISVVRKGQDGRNIPNATNYMALTNHEDALVLDADDRRWGVFFTRFKTRQEMIDATGPDYWDKLNNAINGAPGVVRGWLMDVDLSTFDARDAPALTDAKKQMIEHSRPDDEVQVEEAINVGGFGVCRDVVATDCLVQVLKDQGGHLPRTSRLSVILASLGLVKLEKPFKWRSKTRRLYVRGDALCADMNEARDAIRLHLEGTADPELADFADTISSPEWARK